MALQLIYSQDQRADRLEIEVLKFDVSRDLQTAGYATTPRGQGLDRKRAGFVPLMLYILSLIESGAVLSSTSEEKISNLSTVKIRHPSVILPSK
jgi:hypothetical protein